MLIKIKHSLVLLFFLCSLSTRAQKFFGSVLFGTNISQIDGDFAAGFNKYSLTGGVRVDYPITAASDICAELLFSGRGSKDNRRGVDIRLNYIEIPLLFSLRDWYIEKDKYDKVRAEAGLSYGYLFNADGDNTFVQYVPRLAKNDLSFVIGAGYMFTRNIGVSVRYTRSFFKIVKDPKFETGGLLSYFTTVRMEYHF